MNTVTVSALSPSISHSAIFWNTLIHISLEIFTQCNAGKKKCGSFWKFREVFLLKIASQLNTGREETKNGEDTVLGEDILDKSMFKKHSMYWETEIVSIIRAQSATWQ